MSTKLRVLRVQRNLTLEDLATSAGLTRSYVSKVERGLSVPSIGAALKLARALGITVEELFGEAAGSDPVTIVRKAAAGPDGHLPGASTLITGTAAGHEMLAFVLHPRRANSPAHPMSHHAGEELMFVVSGSVGLQLAGRKEVLAAGDCAHFSAAVPHKITSLGEADAEVLVVILPERGGGSKGAEQPSAD
jgi:transcriptional regulator with XRE-family HTH domain